MNESGYQTGTLRGPIDNVLSRLERVKRCGREWSAKCPGPGHRRGDKNPSLTIDVGTENKVLLSCHKGCNLRDIVNAIDLEVRDLFDNTSQTVTPIPYNYDNENGELMYQVRRFGKEFPVRRPDGNGGWINDAKGVERIPYNLPAVIEAINQHETVYVVEGEQDADRLSSLGLVATCNCGGALKWGMGLSRWFRGATIIILPDNDKIGLDHAKFVSDSLRGIAASVRIIELPGLPEKGDVSDWLGAGNSKEQLVDMIDHHMFD